MLGAYGIYVNYRHLSTLCDIMTQRGIITSITRHGINRGESGPLRKCSFEETVEILLEASVFCEVDLLKGITENLIMGQLAPFGTGSFQLVVDLEALQYAHVKDEECEEPGSTPLINYYNGNYPMNVTGTPLNSNTPHYNGIGSEYGQNTPGYEGAFTPNPMQSPNSYMSPAYSG